MCGIAVVIINYRSERLVGELLKSIARQGANWVSRVIVVDNASGDGSVEALMATVRQLGVGAWVDVLDAGRNGGFGTGNNFGAAAAMQLDPRPDVLWFLNPDTLVENVDLGHALGWFEHDPRVGVVGTGLADEFGGHEMAGHRTLSPISEFVREAGALRLLRRYASSDLTLDRPGPVDWVSGASLIIRAEVFEQLGGFDEGYFLYFEEVDLCRRARSAGWDVIYDPRVRVIHLEGQTTGVRKAESRPTYWYESRRRYFVKHYGVLGLAAADVAWGLGRVVGTLRRRTSGACRWGDLLRCDGPVILGRKRLSVEHVP